YKILLIGLGLIALGFILMAGGGSDDPNVFNADELFSWRRIRLAPTVVLIGFGVTIYAILKNPNATTQPLVSGEKFPEDQPIKTPKTKK
ncbi:MAG: DUF3098 domain-containing protein, partial [Sphingobacteriales bacterium]